MSRGLKLLLVALTFAAVCAILLWNYTDRYLVTPRLASGIAYAGAATTGLVFLFKGPQALYWRSDGRFLGALPLSQAAMAKQIWARDLTLAPLAVAPWAGFAVTSTAPRAAIGFVLTIVVLGAIVSTPAAILGAQAACLEPNPNAPPVPSSAWLGLVPGAIATGVLAAAVAARGVAASDTYWWILPATLTVVFLCCVVVVLRVAQRLDFHIAKLLGMNAQRHASVPIYEVGATDRLLASPLSSEAASIFFKDQKVLSRRYPLLAFTIVVAALTTLIAGWRTAFTPFVCASALAGVVSLLRLRLALSRPSESVRFARSLPPSAGHWLTGKSTGVAKYALITFGAGVGAAALAGAANYWIVLAGIGAFYLLAATLRLRHFRSTAD